ncbi:MAG: hypothetical protein U1E27_10055, partial [Kiritimatiellia bacterium]|nr:hypothetical protein [Kiritimatiellia bacterium]
APPVLVLPRDETKPDDVILADLPDDRVQIRGYHDPELDRLEIRCKSLWLLGCRTEMYYRDWFRTHAPNTDLVTTLCALDTLADTRRVLQTLLLALDERRSVQDILAVLNHNREFARLQGYREEIHRYNRKADPPAALYYAEDRPPAL